MNTPSKFFRGRGRGTRAFSLMEAMVLIVILGIVGAGTGRALVAVTHTPESNDVQFQLELSMVSEMERLRSISFDKLIVGTYITGVNVYKTHYPMTLVIDVNDPNDDGHPQPELKSITITVAGRSLTTLVSKP
jgi:type II secretory pathway pseudopilin PulG